MFDYDNFLDIVDRQVAEFQRLSAAGQEPFYVEDSELGWVIRPDARNQAGNASSDRHGFRTAQSAQGPDLDDDPRPILSIWGCSIVEGCEVADRDTWGWQLQEHLGSAHRLLNGGVSAYGCDQALLRLMRSEQRWHSDIAVLGYASTDLFRHVNMQRSFLHHGGEYMTLKPRFRRQGEDYTLLHPPQVGMANARERFRDPELKAYLAANDSLFPHFRFELVKRLRAALGVANPLRHDRRLYEEAVAVTIEIFERFFAFCEASGIRGIALLLPMHVGLNRTGEDVERLARHLRGRGHEVIDPRARFAATIEDPERYFTPRAHYLREGGAILARAVADHLEAGRAGGR